MLIRLCTFINNVVMYQTIITGQRDYGYSRECSCKPWTWSRISSEVRHLYFFVKIWAALTPLSSGMDSCKNFTFSFLFVFFKSQLNKFYHTCNYSHLIISPSSIPSVHQYSSLIILIIYVIYNIFYHTDMTSKPHLLI